MCDRTDSIAAVQQAADQLMEACTTRCPDLLRDSQTVECLPITPDSECFSDLLGQLNGVAYKPMNGRKRRGKSNGHRTG